ncbi:MAG: chemotaxis protein CheX [Acidobacteria bacterium]|nr:chemotaxis protein CheX [Acidobacteriota bacterium]
MTEELLHRDEVMAAEMVGAARDVLNVMFFTDILEEADECACTRPLPIQVRVTFTGHQSGEFRLEVDELAAGSLAGSFLGADPVAGPNPEEVDQVMGELGNMICGAFLSRFEKEGLFALASPQVHRPAHGEIPGIHRGLELMDGFMDLRMCWGSIPG